MTERIPVPDPVYGPIAAFAGQLAALGVRDVVISPGSRSTPLSLAFHTHPALRTHIQLDERSAGFFALGQAKASGRPSVLICTSGTAAAGGSGDSRSTAELGNPEHDDRYIRHGN